MFIVRSKCSTLPPDRAHKVILRTGSQFFKEQQPNLGPELREELCHGKEDRARRSNDPTEASNGEEIACKDPQGKKKQSGFNPHHADV